MLNYCKVIDWLFHTKMPLVEGTMFYHIFINMACQKMSSETESQPVSIQQPFYPCGLTTYQICQQSEKLQYSAVFHLLHHVTSSSNISQCDTR